MLGWHTCMLLPQCARTTQQRMSKYYSAYTSSAYKLQPRDIRLHSIPMLFHMMRCVCHTVECVNSSTRSFFSHPILVCFVLGRKFYILASGISVAGAMTMKLQSHLCTNANTTDISKYISLVHGNLTVRICHNIFTVETSRI